MNDDHINAICAVCVFFGAIVPWALLLIGGVMSIFLDSAYWGETAAYLTATGLIFMLGSYVLSRISDIVASRS